MLMHLRVFVCFVFLLSANADILWGYTAQSTRKTCETTSCRFCYGSHPRTARTLSSGSKFSSKSTPSRLARRMLSEAQAEGHPNFERPPAKGEHSLENYQQGIHPVKPGSDDLMAGYHLSSWPPSPTLNTAPASIAELGQLRARMFAKLNYDPGSGQMLKGNGDVQTLDHPNPLQGETDHHFRMARLSKRTLVPKPGDVSMSGEEEPADEKNEGRNSGAGQRDIPEQSHSKSKRKSSSIMHEAGSRSPTSSKRPARTIKLPAAYKDHILDPPSGASSKETRRGEESHERTQREELKREAALRERLRAAGLSSPKSIKVKSIHRSDGPSEARRDRRPEIHQGTPELQGLERHQPQTGPRLSDPGGSNLPITGSHRFKEIVHKYTPKQTPSFFPHKIDLSRGRGFLSEHEISYLTKQSKSHGRGESPSTILGPPQLHLPHPYGPGQSLHQAMHQGESSSMHRSHPMWPVKPPLRPEQHPRGLPQYRGSPQFLRPEQEGNMPSSAQSPGVGRPPGASTEPHFPLQRPSVVAFGSPFGKVSHAVPSDPPPPPPLPPAPPRADSPRTHSPPVDSHHPQ